MPPRFSYWTILIGGAPTAFRAKEREELLPTLNQLTRTNADVTLRFFARGKLWDSPEQAQWAGKQEWPRENRGREWRPGGTHKDPRARFDKRASGKSPRPPRDGDDGGEREARRPAGRDEGFRRDRPESDRPRSQSWQNREDRGSGAPRDSRPKTFDRPPRPHTDTDSPRPRRDEGDRPSGGGRDGWRDRPWSPKASAEGRRPWTPKGESQGRRPWEPRSDAKQGGGRSQFSDRAPQDRPGREDRGFKGPRDRDDSRGGWSPNEREQKRPWQPRPEGGRQKPWEPRGGEGRGGDTRGGQFRGDDHRSGQFRGRDARGGDTRGRDSRGGESGGRGADTRKPFGDRRPRVDNADRPFPRDEQRERSGREEHRDRPGGDEHRGHQGRDERGQHRDRPWQPKGGDGRPQGARPPRDDRRPWQGRDGKGPSSRGPAGGGDDRRRGDTRKPFSDKRPWSDKPPGSGERDRPWSKGGGDRPSKPADRNRPWAKGGHNDSRRPDGDERRSDRPREDRGDSRGGLRGPRKPKPRS